MNRVILLIAVFSLGYVVNDIAEQVGLQNVKQANAVVAGSDYHDFRRSRDFIEAVRWVVQGCTVNSSRINC